MVKLSYEPECIYWPDEKGGFYIFSGRLNSKQWDYLEKWAKSKGFIKVGDTNDKSRPFIS
jgi:hypothetical protein